MHKNKLILSFLLSPFFLHGQIAGISWGNLPQSTVGYEKSLCNFKDGSKIYALRLQKTGLKNETFIPILEIAKENSDKVITISIQLGAGKENEPLQLTAANYFDGYIYILALGLKGSGAYHFYSGKLSLEGELKGGLKSLKVPIHANGERGTPIIVPGSIGSSQGQFSLILFAQGAESEQTRQFIFDEYDRLKIGVLALNQKFEVENNDILEFPVKAKGFRLDKVFIAAEGDMLLSVQSGLGKKVETVIYHTHVFRLNKLKKEEINLNPQSGKHLLITDDAGKIIVSWCEQLKYKDPVKIWVNYYEKGEFRLLKTNTYTLNAEEKSEIDMPSKGNNFNLMQVYNKAEGLFLLGSFYEELEVKTKKGSMPKPNIVNEYYYTLIRINNNAELKWYNFPVFAEKGAFSPAVSWQDDRLYLVFNTHANNVKPGAVYSKLLSSKDVAKNACVIAEKISIFEGSMGREVIMSHKDKLRLLTAFADTCGNEFSIEAITKQSAGEANKNYVKLARISFK